MFVNKENINNTIKTWLIIMYFLVITMVVVGGLTRLTDSGLSITSWELFSGLLPPVNIEEWNYYFNEYKKIPEYKYVNSGMSISEFKVIFYWEYAHRLLARIVGLASLIPILYLSMRNKGSFLYLKKYLIIFFLICLQGFIGWFMVSSGLVNNTDVSHYRLALHLSVALIIIIVILWQIFLIYDVEKFNLRVNNSIILILFFLIFFQIVIGAFLAGLNGGLIYNTWPDMNGYLYPNDISLNYYLTLESFSNPSVIQFYHRLIGYLIIIFVLFLNYIFLKKKIEMKYMMIFNFTILFQIILGILALTSGVEIKFASLHQFGSILVLSSYLLIFYKNTN